MNTKTQALLKAIKDNTVSGQLPHNNFCAVVPIEAIKEEIKAITPADNEMIFNMDKQELLDEIEKKEIARLNKLSFEELKKEHIEWFDIAEQDETNDVTMRSELMNDFMMYRRDEGIEELQEVLTRYK